MRKFTILLLIFCLIININIFYADNSMVTKKDLIKEAVDNSFLIKQQENNLQQIDHEYKSAMVNLRIYSFYKDMNERLLEINNIKTPSTADQIEKDIILLSTGYYETDKQDSMMLLPKDVRTLNLRHTLEIYNNAKENAVNSLMVSMNTVLSQIEISKQQIGIQKMLISNLEQNLLSANKKYAFGLISESQLKQLELKKKIADIELNKLNLNHLSLYNQLSKVVGENILYDLEITQDATMEIQEVEPLEYYINYAMENKKDIRIAYSNSLFRDIEYQTAIQNYGIESENESFRQSYITYRNTVNDYEDLKLNIQLQIINIYGENQQQAINLEKAQNNLELAQSRYSQAKQQYNLGQITDYELANANIDLIRGQSEFFKAKENAYVSRLKLKQACGMLIQ